MPWLSSGFPFIGVQSFPVSGISVGWHITRKDQIRHNCTSALLSGLLLMVLCRSSPDLELCTPWEWHAPEERLQWNPSSNSRHTCGERRTLLMMPRQSVSWAFAGQTETWVPQPLRMDLSLFCDTNFPFLDSKLGEERRSQNSWRVCRAFEKRRGRVPFQGS